MATQAEKTKWAMLQIDKLLRLERRITALHCSMAFAVDWRAFATGKGGRGRMLAADDATMMKAKYRRLQLLILFRAARLAKLESLVDSTCLALHKIKLDAP